MWLMPSVAAKFCTYRRQNTSLCEVDLVHNVVYNILVPSLTPFGQINEQSGAKTTEKILGTTPCNFCFKQMPLSSSEAACLLSQIKDK